MVLQQLHDLSESKLGDLVLDLFKAWLLECVCLVTRVLIL